MLISEIEGVAFASEYPELIGSRVLVTGAQGQFANDVLFRFAEARARLAIITTGNTEITAEARKKLAQEALSVRFLPEAGAAPDALSLVRAAVQCFGGIDCVVNIVAIDEQELQSAADAERQIGDLLALPCLATRIAANRMRVMRTAGSILNIVTSTRALSRRGKAAADVVRGLLGAFTRAEARTWAADGIRVNAIAPGLSDAAPSTRLSLGPDVATLAVHLAAGREHALTGLTFEAYAA